MKVLFVTVDHNNNGFTRQFLDSLDEFINYDISVIVVYNGNEKNIHNEYKNITVNFFETENNGYFAGIRYGLNKANLNDYDHIIVCNNDVEILGKTFFKSLEKYLYKKYYVLAPSIKTLDDKEQNPHSLHPPSFLKRFYYRVYFLNYYIALLLTYTRTFIKKSKPKKSTKECEIFSPHGAFIIFSKDFFLEGGEIEDSFFLYAEEDSIAGYCFENNIKIIFDPSISIKHYESATLKRGLSSFKWFHQKQGNKFSKSMYPNLF